MTKQEIIVALVPMRHESERVPGKNYRLIAGKPLYHHIIGTLLACPDVSQVVIDTDSPVILEEAARVFPSVVLIERPSGLRGGEVPMNAILLHDVCQIAADFYLQTHSTNPLLKQQTITTAIETLLGAWPDKDSLFGVTALQTRLWRPDGQPLNHDPDVLLRTQDLPPVLEENSNLYIFTRETLKRRHNRIGERPLLFQIDRAEAWDIDEELDFTIAERLLEESMTRRELG
jgi:CMP-N-acetylneuraminic acid synthetase